MQINYQQMGHTQHASGHTQYEHQFEYCWNEVSLVQNLLDFLTIFFKCVKPKT